MAALAPEKTRAIEVQDFVDLDEIDPIYFDSPYYLGPADGAEKAYSLLGAGDGGLAARSRSPASSSATRSTWRRSAPTDGVLTLTTMRFADEVVPPAELDDVLPEEKPKVGEERESRWPSS